jgi:hypothetical protein
MNWAGALTGKELPPGRNEKGPARVLFLFGAHGAAFGSQLANEFARYVRGRTVCPRERGETVLVTGFAILRAAPVVEEQTMEVTQ